MKRRRNCAPRHPPIHTLNPLPIRRNADRLRVRLRLRVENEICSLVAAATAEDDDGREAEGQERPRRGLGDDGNDAGCVERTCIPRFSAAKVGAGNHGEISSRCRPVEEIDAISHGGCVASVVQGECAGKGQQAGDDNPVELASADAGDLHGCIRTAPEGEPASEGDCSGAVAGLEVAKNRRRSAHRAVAAESGSQGDAEGSRGCGVVAVDEQCACSHGRGAGVGIRAGEGLGAAAVLG